MSKIDGIDKDKLFFTADTHFGHANIIKYCNRPFFDIEHMDKELINNWNTIVPEDGTVFHLGDVSFKGKRGVHYNYIDQLNGDIYIALGNHDRESQLRNPKLKKVTPYMVLDVEDDEVDYGRQRIVMLHYPMLTWLNKNTRGSWHLFGHVHGMLEGKYPSPNMLDVGVDVQKYRPISYEEVKIQITKQNLNR